jgi:predicted  nucleic acid-binding Zn-ribbon protein
MSLGTALLELQRADDHLSHVEAQIHASESMLRGDPDLDAGRRRQADAEAAERTAALQLRERELEVETLRQRVQQLDRKLYGGTIGNPQELLGMQREIEGLRERIAAEEEGVLELMEVAEEALKLQTQERTGVAEMERRREAALGPEREHLERLKGEHQQAVADRDARAAEVEPAALALYRRIAARVRPAVARLDGDACGGCHLPMAHQEARSARAGTQLTQCANCDRIVVA